MLESAAALYLDAISADAASAGAHYGLGVALRKLGACAAVFGDAAYSPLERGKKNAKTSGRHADALASLKRSVELDPTGITAGRCFLRTNC